MSMSSDILCSTSDILNSEDANYLYNSLGTVELFPENLPQEEFMALEDTKYLISPLSGVLLNQDLSGDYEFEVNIHPNGSKNSWVYSSVLNKVYMDIKCTFPVDFKLKSRPDMPVIIRVTPVFSAPQYAHESVSRCVNHSYSDSKEFPAFQHIIRCENTKAYYQGDLEKKEHLSIIIPFPLDGTDSIREVFMFVCKNSCPYPGINRRDIEVLFTLEDYFGNVLGRRPLNVRICSCPNRDKGKDEEKYKTKNEPIPKGKKRKVEMLVKVPVSSGTLNSDFENYELTMPVCGKNHVKQVLKFYHDLLAGDIHELQDKERDEPLRKCLEKVTELRKSVETEVN